MDGKLDRGWILLALLAAHCGAGETGTRDASSPWTLSAAVPEMVVVPGDTASIWFSLTDADGHPVPGQVVSFSLTAQNNADGRGATLASDTGVTDGAGKVATSMSAGLPAQLRVTARSSSTEPAVALVWVSTDPFRKVEVAFSVAAGASSNALSTARVDALFYDSSSCAQAASADAAVQARPLRSVNVDASTLFENVSATQRHAIVGRGRNAGGRMVTIGCVELEGFALASDVTMHVVVALQDPHIAATGTYSVVSSFRFKDPLPVAKGIAAPWADLTDCPLDPGQRWLDCTIDALNDADPLDCEPAEDEGAIGAALMSLRGAIASATGCRPAMAGGVTSLDADVAAMFPSGENRPALLTGLPSLATDALLLLDDLNVQSSMSLQSTIDPARFAITHSFVAITLSVGSQLDRLDLAQLGLPSLTAFSSGIERQGGVDIDQHGITLRLGTVARAGFSDLVLATRNLPTATSDLVTSLLTLAVHGDVSSPTTGCAALDALVCDRLALGAGCLGQACVRGRQALAARLEKGFQDADGDGLDLLLAGSAPVIDGDGDWIADYLGVAPPGAPGLWAAELRARAGKATFSGLWAGTRR